MKKLLIAVALLVASSFVFANDSFLESILENFWCYGDVVKIVENDKITYVNKCAISTIELDGDKVTIINSTYNTQAKANWTLKYYNLKNYYISKGDHNNVVITKK